MGLLYWDVFWDFMLDQYTWGVVVSYSLFYFAEYYICYKWFLKSYLCDESGIAVFFVCVKNTNVDMGVMFD